MSSLPNSMEENNEKDASTSSVSPQLMDHVPNEIDRKTETDEQNTQELEKQQKDHVEVSDDQKTDESEKQAEEKYEMKTEVQEASEIEVSTTKPSEEINEHEHVTESVEIQPPEHEKTFEAEVIEPESDEKKETTAPSEEKEEHEAPTSEPVKTETGSTIPHSTISESSEETGHTTEIDSQKESVNEEHPESTIDEHDTDKHSYNERMTSEEKPIVNPLVEALPEEPVKPITREEFNAEMDKVFEQMRKKSYNFNTIRHLTEMVQPEFKFDMETTKKVLEMLVHLTREVDIRLREHFLPLVQKTFHACEDYHSTMRYLYEHPIFERENSKLPNYHIPYKEYYTQELAHIQSRIGPFENMDEKALDELAKELGFLMMITPQETAINFLIWAVSAPPVIPTVTRLFERLRTVAELRIKRITGADASDSFWLEMFKHVFTNHHESLKLDTEDGRNGFQQIALNFMRTRMKAQKTGGGDKPVLIATNRPNMDATEFVMNFLFEHLSRNYETRLMLSIMSGLMTTDNRNRYDIRWTKPDGKCSLVTSQKPILVQNDHLTIEPNIFVAYPVHMFIYADAGDANTYSEICSIIPKLFTGIARKLSADSVKVKAKFVLAKTSILDWAYKYAIGVWLQSVLEDYKPEIPSALYYCLPEDKKLNHCRLAMEEPVSYTEDFFCSIFELALVLPEAALDFLSYATCATPNIDDISTQICMALEQTTQKEKKVAKLMALIPVIDRLIDLYGVPLLTYGFVKFYSVDAATAKGLREMLPSLMFGEAVRVSLLLKKADDKKWLDDNETLMMVAFSNLVYKKIQEFSETLREGNQRGKVPSITPGPLIAISNQLAVVRFLVNAIEELLQEMGQFNRAPAQFQKLSMDLAECIRTWFNTKLAPNLDDFKRLEGEDASRTVYAYVPPTEEERKADQTEKLQYFENLLEQLEKDAIPRVNKRQEKTKGGTFYNKSRGWK